MRADPNRPAMDFAEFPAAERHRNIVVLQIMHQPFGNTILSRWMICPGYRILHAAIDLGAKPTMTKALVVDTFSMRLQKLLDFRQELWSTFLALVRLRPWIRRLFVGSAAPIADGNIITGQITWFSDGTVHSCKTIKVQHFLRNCHVMIIQIMHQATGNIEFLSSAEGRILEKQLMRWEAGSAEVTAWHR